MGDSVRTLPKGETGYLLFDLCCLLFGGLPWPAARPYDFPFVIFHDFSFVIFHLSGMGPVNRDSSVVIVIAAGTASTTMSIKNAKGDLQIENDK